MYTYRNSESMRWKATVSYDGSKYAGWQRQTNALGIQEIIEGVLLRLHKSKVEIVASGRTDAQVHAYGQVFHFDSDKEIAEDHWKLALNSMLPKDIRIQKVERVHDDFHARFHAERKRYDYLVSRDVDNPFLQNYMAMDNCKLDVAYMRECAIIFIGTHDFTSFTSAKIDPRKPRIKTISRLEIIEEETCVRLIFEGNGFLRYMVRMLAQVLIEAGKHRLDKAQLQHMLNGKDKHLCRYKADACGLYLMQVMYGGEL